MVKVKSYYDMGNYEVNSIFVEAQRSKGNNAIYYNVSMVTKDSHYPFFITGPLKDVNLAFEIKNALYELFHKNIWDNKDINIQVVYDENSAVFSLEQI